MTACAVLLFTLPLAWAVAQVSRQGAVVRPQRDAIWVAAHVESRPMLEAAALSGVVELPHGVDAGVYMPDGRKIAGAGRRSRASPGWPEAAGCIRVLRRVIWWWWSRVLAG